MVVGLALASGDTATCALDGVEAVDELLDSAVYIMASIARCDQKKGNTKFNEVACTMDVAAAVESVNGMINVILKAVGKCGALESDHYKCGLAVSVLTRSFAGLAGASAGVVAKCPKKGGSAVTTVAEEMEDAKRYGGPRPSKEAGEAGNAVLKTHTDTPVKCIINIKDTFKSLFKAIKRIMTIKDNCVDPNSKDCAHNALKVVSAFVALGEYMAGAVGMCSSQHSATALCTQMSLRLARNLENVAKASIAMSRDCSVGAAERLYLENAEDAEAAPASNKATMALGALLPLTAVVAFVGGARFAKSRAQVTSDSELLVEGREIE